ncbi:MAG TPA: 3-hydroxyacyl-CoA dehydrogenase NAD-binding domain-containing protein [Candidatus Kapabacteria bacterium]|nr:3-hydroxyacyl-CoA dehydrogenase NAD-binding domain-containing protein [Candidatus Kapabacteria bacterium]
MINFNKHIKIGVLGSGSMGTGIAQIASTSGHDVIIYDNNIEQLKKSKESLHSVMRMLSDKGKIDSEEAESILSRFQFTDNLNELSKCGLIIEAIIEDLDCKRRLFSQLDEIVKEDCFLATNTSSLPVVAVAGGSRRPERVIGLHFFNPAPLMKLVEIVPAITTDKNIAELCYNLMKEWGKTPVFAKDTPGFIVNKVARPYYGEALRIYDEGIADFATIDYAMETIGNFKMGPFKLMDLIGNDINYKVTETVFKEFYYDQRYKPSITQRRYVEAGWYGRKCNKGFYDYNSTEKPEPNEHKELLNSIFNRIIAMLINEAADTLMMGIASKEDIDLAVRLGVNYPKGLLEWANEIGIEKIANTLHKLYERYNEDRYRISPLLKDMAHHHTTF